MKIGSICSGAGIALHGLGELVWGIECDPQIALIYAKNHPQSRLIQDYVQSVIPSNLEGVEAILATPSCKNASIANPKAAETADDVAVAEAVAGIVKEKLPKFFVLENVQGYAKFESFRIIRNILHQCGYYSSFQILNLKDFGIAQNRKRLYLMAVRGGYFLELKSHAKIKGWYEVIEDLIPQLPETKLADWQLKRFPQLADHSLIPDHSNWSPLVPPQKPANTVRAGHTSFRALIKRVGGGRESDRLYSPQEPPPTIRALGRKCGNHSHQLDAVVGDKIVEIPAYACLRFFGGKEIADQIWLPKAKSLAMEAVGNGASWEIMKTILNHIKNSQ